MSQNQNLTPIIIQAQPQGQSTMDKLMVHSEKCGKFVGLSGGVVCAIIILILCAVGIYFYRKKQYAIYNTILATITEANCSQVINDNGRNRSVSYNCALKVKYTINGEEYQNSLQSNDTIHNVGEIREIYYNTTNPYDITYSYITNKNLGRILLGVGSCFFILFIVHIVLTMKSEWYNRLQCVSAVSSAVAAPFRRN